MVFVTRAQQWMILFIDMCLNLTFHSGRLMLRFHRAIAIAKVTSLSLGLFSLIDSDGLASLKMGIEPIQNLAMATSLLLNGNSPKEIILTQFLLLLLLLCGNEA